MSHLRATMRRLLLAAACASLLAVPAGAHAKASHSAVHHATGKSGIDVTTLKPAAGGVGRKGH